MPNVRGRRLRLRFWRTEPTVEPGITLLTGLSTETYLGYHAIVRSVLVCERCGWNWAYHDDGECPTPAQQQQIIAVDGR